MQRDHFKRLYDALDILFRLIELGLAACVLLWMVYFGISLVHSAQFAQVRGVAELHRYGDPIVARTAHWLRAEWAIRYVPLVLAAACWVVIIVVERLFNVVKRAIWSVAPRQTSQAAGLRADSEQAREELYRQYREIEKALKEAKRKRCTFLSIDIAGSTAMKDGESELTVTASFRAFEEMLKRNFSSARAWKQAWTPDGVMACFLSRDQAISAAKAILCNLEAFNEVENQLKAPFQVRCGINEGEVVLFDDTNLEKAVDQAIDIAAHMQKSANPNSIWLSADMWERLDDASGFRATGKNVDGLPVFEWSVPVTAV